MKKKQIVVLLIVFTFLNVAAIAVFSNASQTSTKTLDRGIKDLTPEDLGDKEIAIRKQAAEVGSALATGASAIGEPAELGDTFTFDLSDDYYGTEYPEEFVVLLEGEHCLILITTEANESYDGTYYHYDNPYGTWGVDEHLITLEQLEYLKNEFDNTIYPRVTGVFGEPLPRGDEGQKIWTLIFNIRDDSYYDDSAESYVVGYFSASTSAEYNKNIMHIDTYDWENRAGPGTSQVMEGVFAHEFQHLVHFDQDPDEPSWVDEGCADLASYLCGYGHWTSHIFNYLAYHWFTPLTFWGNSLADYGASYLFALYLYEHYGGDEFFRTLVQEQANGIEGIENALKTMSCGHGHRNHHRIPSFNEIFDDWTIANYLDDTTRKGGKYGYYTLDIPSDDTGGWSMDDILSYGWGEPIFSGDWELAGWWGSPQPYTAHYYRFTNDDWAKVYIDGADTSGTPAYSGTYEWYSDANAWAWRSFSQNFTIPEDGTTTLNFYTYFEIEDDWDYGYVEVNDGGHWYTLNDPSFMMYVYNSITDEYDYVPMRDFVAIAQDNPNCPAGREPTDYEAAGEWYGFTGLSNGWVPVSMDLTPFAGKNIEIHFRLWQDGAFTLQNMYVDDIEITNDVFPLDDVESGENGWTTDGWYITDGILENNWEVTVLNLDYPLVDPEVVLDLNYVLHMWVWSGTQSGIMWVSPSRENNIRLIIVSNRADHILTSDYVIGVNVRE